MITMSRGKNRGLKTGVKQRILMQQWSNNGAFQEFCVAGRSSKGKSTMDRAGQEDAVREFILC